MAEAQRDQNRVTGLLLEDDTTGLTVPALRDSAGRLLTVGVIADDSSIQKIEVSSEGVLVGTRKEINFDDSGDINFTITDDLVNNRVNITATGVPSSNTRVFVFNQDSLDPSVYTDWSELQADAALVEGWKWVHFDNLAPLIDTGTYDYTDQVWVGAVNYGAGPYIAIPEGSFASGLPIRFDNVYIDYQGTSAPWYTGTRYQITISDSYLEASGTQPMIHFNDDGSFGSTIAYISIRGFSWLFKTGSAIFHLSNIAELGCYWYDRAIIDVGVVTGEAATFWSNEIADQEAAATISDTGYLGSYSVIHYDQGNSTIQVDGLSVGTEESINFIQGTHIDIDAAVNPGNFSVDVTLSSTVFDATVNGGGGADYLTLKEAIDAGHARIMVMGNTTEVSNITIPGATMPYLYLYINQAVTVDMGAFRFIDTGAPIAIYLRGEGTISYLHENANEELFDLSGGMVLDHDGPKITNLSTQAGCSIAIPSMVQRIRNCVISLPNVDRGGIYCTAQGSNNFSNIVFVDGGTSCTRGFDIESVDSPATNITFNCDFKPSSATSTDAAVVLYRVIASNLVFRNLSGSPIRLTIDGISTISNICDPGGDGVDLYVSGGLTNISNCTLEEGDVIIQSSEITLTNVICSGTLSFSATNDSDNYFSNCLFGSNTTATTIISDRNSFTNCTFATGAVVANGADNNGFANCRFYDGAAGESETLTIDATALNTRVIGCVTDVAIVDNGSGTVSLANIIV